jgi:2-oxoglutarate dehydrogenase E2 component (dihydrolipoamide succinyltransferase)
MATEVIMPQMGESIAEGTITRWLVKVGDKVQRDQPLFEISTDKVDAEIPSPAEGVLLEVRAQEGQTVPVHQVVAIIGAGAEAAAPASEPAPAPAAGRARDDSDRARGGSRPARSDPGRPRRGTDTR